MFSSLTRKLVSSLASNHRLRFASSVAYATAPYKPKPKPIQKSSTRTLRKVSSPSSTLVSSSKKLNEKLKTSNNETETLSSSVLQDHNKSEEKLSEQRSFEEDSDDEPEWFKKIEHINEEKETMDEDFSAEKLPELHMEGVDWEKTRPTEYRNGEIVYKIIDNPGEKKLMLVRECKDGELIKIVSKMPSNGHAYNDREVLTIISIKKGDKRTSYCIQSRCTKDRTCVEYLHDSLEERGIDKSLFVFVQEYMIKKFLKEKLFPYIKEGW